jgi:hypothetical protein
VILVTCKYNISGKCEGLGPAWNVVGVLVYRADCKLLGNDDQRVGGRGFQTLLGTWEPISGRFIIGLIR